LPPPASTGSPNSPYGGSGWAFSISGSCRPIPSRRALTNGCIARSRRRRRGHLRRIWPRRCQRAFNRFRVLYNEERPHQFLDGRTPASLYRPSPRSYTGALPPIEYPGHYIPKRVTDAGTIRFKTRLRFIAHSLKQQVLGLEEVEDGVWSIYFCRVLLAGVDERDYVLRP
jgi:hypothetical protein